MVSGHLPIKARKLRYYQDANFTRRVLPPPVLFPDRYADVPDSRPDDWSGLATPPTPTVPVVGDAASGDTDEGGLRRQVELSEGDAFNPEFEPLGSDLALLDDDDDLPLSMPSQFDPRLQRAARLAALDPDDGIPL